MVSANPNDGRQPAVVGRLKSVAFGAIRRGPRDVHWTEPGYGFGNILYQWLWAHVGQQRGLDRKVLFQPEMTPWLNEFPAVRDRLIIERSDLKYRDHRTVGSSDAFSQSSAMNIKEFSQDLIFTAPIFIDAFANHPVAESMSDLAIHVRRGSYYDDPTLRELYGIDLPGYLQTALQNDACVNPPPKNIKIISNDQEWCKNNLHFLRNFADSVSFGDSTATAAEDFRDLVLSRRLIVGNSTFAYWAAYLSNVIYQKNHSLIWAPLFHVRQDRWQSEHLDPRWNIVRNIPGGWEEKNLSD